MSAIGTRLDANQVIQQGYDEANKRHRVDALISATISDVAIKDSQGNELDVQPDGSINVNVINPIDIEISAADGDNIAISDGVNTLTVNPDGTISVHVIPGVGGAIVNEYNEITSVPAAVLSNILTYTALANGKIKQVNVAGSNKGVYTIEIASSVVDKAYTYFTEFNHEFDCGEGLSVSLGQQILVRVIHNRPFLGDFNARLQFIED